MAHAHAEPVGGPILTRPFKGLLVFIAIWLAVVIWRFAVGIGPVSGLSDGYPWGIWIAFDVVTATALACGGYAVALLAYIFNKGKYHPLVRPAILTSALGYSLAALAIMIDVGRPWFIYRIPIRVGSWNLNSALLEVALCVMAYCGVLWIELAPAFLEKLRDSGASEGLKALAKGGLAFFDKALIFIVALGILLPTMHQSSLGTVMLLAGHRLHPLWNTALVPLLFLLTCIAMGYAVVVWEATMSSRAFNRPREDGMLKQLSGVMAGLLIAFVVIRVGEIVVTGKAGALFGSGFMSVLFWIENLLFAGGAWLLMGSRKERFSNVMSGSLLIMFAGAAYRFNAYIVAFDPGPGWSYFPTLSELIITFGIVALEIALYIVIVKRLPILGGHAPAADRA
jgi:Ni/Fe-hydrogenase subunit HybB-like protein